MSGRFHQPFRVKEIGVSVTDSNSQSIGGVFLSYFGKFEQGFDHLLYLDFFSFAVADNSALDL